MPSPLRTCGCVMVIAGASLVFAASFLGVVVVMENGASRSSVRDSPSDDGPVPASASGLAEALGDHHLVGDLHDGTESCQLADTGDTGDGLPECVSLASNDDIAIYELTTTKVAQTWTSALAAVRGWEPHRAGRFVIVFKPGHPYRGRSTERLLDDARRLTKDSERPL